MVEDEQAESGQRVGGEHDRSSRPVSSVTKTEANLDGKYLLRCSDPHLSAEDISLGYKQLLEVERGWRDMKPAAGLPPARRTHPRPRHLVLARPAAHPHR
ncbi:hypothetical protein OG320_17580 [Microbispora sp. NBC_01189]|uniref:hypothetical protein n=1 Tax=Microbispora sp. NBC_01189 TaxID=2903583 RepID=UPI002E0DB2C2|nr:hypothetical protein OG320_17580 [Microbispora sp. NBC_01189]